MASDELRGLGPPQSAGKSPSAHLGLNTASEVPDGRDAAEGPQEREPGVERRHRERGEDIQRREAGDREARLAVGKRGASPRRERRPIPVL